MRILFTIESKLENAGVPRIIMDIVKKFSDDTFDIIVLGCDTGYYDEEFKKYGGKIFPLPVYNVKTSYLKYMFRYLIYVIKIRNILKSQSKYDLIHAHGKIQAGSLIYASKNIYEENSIIIHSHGTYTKYRSKNIVMKIINNSLLKKIRNSHSVKVACSEKAGYSLFDTKNFYNILNPVDLDEYRDIMRENSDEIRIVQIGYFSRNKNQLFSLRLLKKLIEMGLKIKLYFIGYISEREYYKKMRQYIVNNNLIDYVSVLKHDYDKKIVFSSSDYLLQPSHIEGLPLVVLEAQAASLTCLISNTISSDVDGGGCYFLDIEDYSQWIEIITGRKKKLFNLENLDKFSYKNYFNNIEKIYKGITNGKKNSK